MPPARRVSNCFEPVVIDMSSLRRECISVAVVKPMGTSFEAAIGQSHGLYGGSLAYPPPVISMPFVLIFPLFVRELVGACVLSETYSTSPESRDSRIGNGFHGVKTPFNHKLDISCSETVDALNFINSLLCMKMWTQHRHTSSAETGVGAPGPPMALSSYCSSSLLILTLM